MSRIELTEGNNKFIHFETDGVEGVVSRNLAWHKDIFHSLRKEIEESSILGGGWIRLDETAKQIHISGVSGNYGGTDRERVRKILREHFGKEYTITTEKESPRKKRGEEQENKTLEEKIAADEESYELLLDSLSVPKKVKLYQKTGVNHLAPTEIKEYVLGRLDDRYPFTEVPDLLTLVQDFNLTSDDELKHHFLSSLKTKVFMYSRKLEECSGHYDHVSAAAPNMKKLGKYLATLERAGFTITTPEVRFLVEEIIEKNDAEIEKHGHTLGSLKLSEENLLLAEEFGLGTPKILEIVVKEIDLRFQPGYSCSWAFSEEQLSKFKATVNRLPLSDRKKLIRKKALSFFKLEYSIKERTICTPKGHMCSAYVFLTHFGNYFGRSHNDEKSFIEERMIESTVDFLRTTSSEGPRNVKDDFTFVNNVRQYSASAKERIDQAIVLTIADAMKIYHAYNHKKCTYLSNLLDADLYTTEELERITNQSCFHLLKEGRIQATQAAFTLFDKPDNVKKELYLSVLENMASEGLTEDNAAHFLEFALLLQELTPDANEVLAKNLSILVRDYIKCYSQNVGKYYTYHMVKFFKTTKLDPADYVEELEKGLDVYSERKGASGEGLSDREKKVARCQFYLDIGLHPENRDEQVECLLQDRVDGLLRSLDVAEVCRDLKNNSRYACNMLEGELQRLGKKRAMDELRSLDDCIRTYTPSAEVVSPKIDVLVREAVKCGRISIAAEMALSYDHELKEELRVLNNYL